MVGLFWDVRSFCLASVDSSTTATPRFSRLLSSVLGSPFVTTSDLPLTDDLASIRVGDDGDGAEMENVDGAFVSVPRRCTVTRPSSPSPSFRTETYSIVNWNDDVFSVDPRPSISDAAPRCSLVFRNSQAQGSSSLNYNYPGTPYNSMRFPNGSPFKASASKTFNLLPKIWDALRESSPGKKGKRRTEIMSISASQFWNELEGDGYIDYANLPPLDGEEGELIDDEACFIDVRAVTGVDIISLLPDEVALYVLSFLDLPDILSCLSVSRTWRRLSQDNLIWRDLFLRRSVDGWGVDLRRDRSRTRLDWYDMYKTRTELDRRWTSPVGKPADDKENATLWEPKVGWMSGHSDSVYCLEFDSSKIITGSRDRTVKVWSLKTGKCLATFAGHNGSVLCLKFDKDFDLDENNSLPVDKYPVSANARAPWKKGFLVTGSSDCSVCVWDLLSCPVEDEDGVVELGVTAQLKCVLRGHTGGVLDLRIDDNWIISCSKDALIRVWNRKTLALHCTFTGHEGPVNALGLQGNRVVSASGDGKMMLWDILTGSRLRTFEGHDRGLACIEFKDEFIVSGSNDCKIKLWNADTGECLKTLTGHDALVRALAFDRRSGRLVSGSYDRSVKVWDVRSGKMLREFKGLHVSHIFDVRFDCARIVSTSHDQKIAVLDFSEGLDVSLFT
ncbi:WD40 repeat-like protein [Panus rudis PR-1116 ss-1]|nr:WD40 repeat-like protein [Panus rudis PR-1116 ss-1]